jgi:hypothetical protein
MFTRCLQNRRQNGLGNNTWAKVDDSKSGIFYTDVRDKIRVKVSETPLYVHILLISVFSRFPKTTLISTESQSSSPG